MKKLQLSESIRLGSLMVSDPTAGDITRCGIAMALHANGAVPVPEDELYPLPPCPYDLDAEEEARAEAELLLTRPAEAASKHWLAALRSHLALSQIYSWLDKIFPCQWCERSLQGTQVVYHPFDDHVMRGEITLDALCSWIASIEPPPECYGITLNLGLGVHFASEAEKAAVLRAAAEARVTASAYIAAAARLAVQCHLSVESYLRPEVKVGPGQDVNYAPHL